MPLQFIYKVRKILLSNPVEPELLGIDHHVGTFLAWPQTSTPADPRGEIAFSAEAFELGKDFRPSLRPTGGSAFLARMLAYEDVHGVRGRLDPHDRS